jgi:hypothetical protein
MKYVGSLYTKMAAYGVALLVAHSAATALAEQQQGKAVVRAIKGSAQYSQGGDWMVLKVNKVLASGAVIKTAADSQVDLWMDQNGPVVRVKPETVLALDSLKFEEPGDGTFVIETKLNLTNGRILGSVKPLAAASKYEVKIPTGTVGIRGTEYDISANGIVSLLQGSATVSYLVNNVLQPFAVNAGQTFTPPTTPGGPPTVGSLVPDAIQFLQDQFKEIRDIGPIIEDHVTPKPAVVPPVEPPISPTTGTSSSGESHHQE